MGLHLKKDDIPLVASPNDELWLVFRDNESLSVAWIESVTANSTVEIASADKLDRDLLNTPTVLTFSQKGIRQRFDLPKGGAATDKFTRIKPTSGRISVSVASPSPFRFFIENSLVFESP